MQERQMDEQWSSSHLAGGNAAYLESLYEDYLADPESVPDDWRAFFSGMAGGREGGDVSHARVRALFERLGRARVPGVAIAKDVISEHERKQVRVMQLMAAYRHRGHQAAALDPLGLAVRDPVPDLELAYHGLSDSDLDISFQTSTLYFGHELAPLRQIIAELSRTYCTHIGAEYRHISNTAERRWIQQRMESVQGLPDYPAERRIALLERLVAAEGLEKNLATKYPGVKRFGLEGGESLIPMMDELIQRLGGYGCKEVVMGMAHRGRLNVLVNILGKLPAELFEEFEGKARYSTSGDVKYHQGFSSNVMTPGGELHLALAFNPSHLEIVSPVVEGSVRARQDRRGDGDKQTVVPILLHGDAAFAGQGVVMETFQMSQTRGYGVGGTIHIVINNQVGFTTSRIDDARSTEYCTDIAKMVQAPIFHVNGDDPEAVLFVSQLAVDYRQTFKRDVVIDLICYRRRGHNEADDPSLTQPLMYKRIAELATTRDLYAQKLISAGVLTREQDQRMIDEYREALERGQHVVKSLVREPNTSLFVDWTPYLGHDWQTPGDTSVELSRLRSLGERVAAVPEGFRLPRQLQRLYDDRRAMARGERPVDWGFAELMAYASLLDAGHPVRLAGQDVGRGTFTHRQAVLHNPDDDSCHVPLQCLAPNQPNFHIYDSLLSELAVLGFEYGYAATKPNALVIWEAQFGDFANGAQIVIDQFISSGEQKWGRLCGLTMLLPHGYEGQGPEHSSARLERFLQLCAEQNIQVCVPSTPAQVFHMLRRQVVRPLRRPLVVMSPKSLLRHKECISSLEELASGGFQHVLAETDAHDPAGVRRVVMCSGKVYYELREARRASERSDVAILRIEQLYPFPEDELYALLAQYPNIEEFVWCQEEPMNQGAWYCSQHHMWRVAHRLRPGLMLSYAGRAASASPAAGYTALHVQQQQQLIKDALNIA